MHFLLFATAVVALNVVPKYHDFGANPLEQAYHDAQIYTVESHLDLTARDLLKYGAVRVKLSNSIITSQLLSEETFNPNYQPKYLWNDNDAAYLINDDKRRKLFYEVDLSEATVTRTTNEWMPIGGCHSNELSETKSTFSQGWSVGIDTSVSAGLQFTAIIGIEPAFGFEAALSVGVSGLMSCAVAPGKKLQFQIKTETVSVANVRQRLIKVNGNYKHARGYLATLEEGDWEPVGTFSLLNRQNIQTACVTDPALLMC